MLKRVARLLILLPILFATAAVGALPLAPTVAVQAQTAPDEPLVSMDPMTFPGTVEGSGTHFEVTDSQYLNVTLDSNLPISARVESIPQMVTLQTQQASGIADLALSGFPPSTTFHRYTDSYERHEVLNSSAEGVLRFSLDLATPHVVFVQPRSSTVFLQDGGWYRSDPANPTAPPVAAPSLGSWDPVTKTGVLGQDLNETIEIKGNNITLDGGGHTLTGSNTGNGVNVAGLYFNAQGFTGVKIRNLTISGFTYGVNVNWGINTTVSSVNVTTASYGYGLYARMGSGNKFSKSTITVNTGNIAYGGYGIMIANESGDTIEDNTVNGSARTAIALVGPLGGSSSFVRGNTVRTTDAMDRAIYSGTAPYATIENNTVDGSLVQNGVLTKHVAVGVEVLGAPGDFLTRNTVKGNTVAGASVAGIQLVGGVENSIEGNWVHNSAKGVILTDAIGNSKYGNVLRNTVRSNTFEANDLGILLNGVTYNVSNNKIFRNNFISNGGQQVSITGKGSGNLFYQPLPDGGNYWSNWTAPDAVEPIGIVDQPYTFTGGQDNFPWTAKNRWLNTPPVAQSGSASIAHKSATGMDITLTATDADNNTLTYGLVGTNGGATRGTVSLTGNVANYVPVGDFVGTDIFQFKASDGSADSNIATVTVTLTNSAPTATVSLPPQVKKTDPISATASPSDADGDTVTLTYTWKRNASLVSGQSSNTYTGPQGVGDTISVEVTPSDGHGSGAVVSASTSVSNTAPVATDGSGTVAHRNNSGVAITLSGTDADGDILTYKLVGTNGVAKNGTVSLSGASAHYTPTGDVVGTDTFQFVANDGTVDSAPATVTVTLTNTAPTVSVTLSPPSPKTGEAITANATPTDDGDTVTLAYVWKVNGNAVSGQPSNTFTATKKGDEVTVEATPSDGHGIGTTGSAKVTVANTAPVASDGSGSTSHRSATGVDITLAATDADGDTFTYSLIGANGGAQKGTVAISGTAAHYTPSADFVGTDSFQFKTNDGTSDSNTATITVTLTNAAPSVTVNLSPSAPKAADSLTASATPSDGDGDNVTLTYVWKLNGTVVSGQSANVFSGAKVKGNVITVEVTPNDGHTNGTVGSASVTVANTAPVANAGSSQSVSEGDNVTLDGSGSTDADGDTLSFKWVQKSGPSVTLSSDGVAKPTFKAPDNGSYVFELTVGDGEATSTASVTVTAGNVAPSVTINGAPSSSIAEGTPVSVSCTDTDPSPVDTTASFTHAWSVTKNGSTFKTGTGASLTFTPDDNGTYVVTHNATDKDNGVGTATKTITVTNVAPTVTITGPAAGSVYPINTAISFTGTYSDPGSADTHTAQWTFDTTNTTTAQNVTGGKVTTSYAFKTTGVFKVKLTVTDDDGSSTSATMLGDVDPVEAFVVIYDPNGGFVTGGGWITSIAGAYLPDLSLSGKATFGFVSKYQKGATVPTGETEFMFHVANMTFQSNTYEWLVIAGARAQYKGFGKINGSGDYGFLLTAIDGQVTGGGGVDKFRIKIWDRATGATYYDNQIGAADDAAPNTALGGGSVVIHSK